MQVLQLPIDHQKYKRSNVMISAKYKSSLLESKITAISLMKVTNHDYEDTPEALVVRHRASELRRLLGGNSGSFYRNLDPVAQAMSGRTIGWTDPAKGQFDYISVVIRANYENGVFSLYLNPFLREHIEDLTANFTILDLPTMLSFKSDASFRLYELLKSKAYYPRGMMGDGHHYISFGLAELKLELGIVNPENEKVKKILRGTKTPNYEKAVEVAPERSYDTWKDFRKWILQKATDEINDLTDMHVTYTPVGGGRGGKIYQVDFDVTYKKKEEPVLSEDERDSFIDFLADIIPCRLKLKEYKLIADTSGYDREKVERAVDALESCEEVDNVVGFLISAIRDGYETSAKVKKSKAYLKVEA